MRQLKLSRQLCGDRRENLGGDFGGVCPSGRTNRL